MLEHGFYINSKTIILTVHVIVNRANEGVWWELMSISNRDEWKTYINEAVECGWPFTVLVQNHVRIEQPDEVMATEEGGEVQEEVEISTNISSADGMADEGERIPAIVEQMEREDVVVTEVYIGNSDEEGDSVPTEWRQFGFEDCSARNTRASEWEYRENEVLLGSKYPNAEAVKEAIKLWSLSIRKEFRVVKSSSSVYDVKYVSEGCPWRVHAVKSRWKSHWTCSIVTEHTCTSKSNIFLCCKRDV
jgi:hypothetical protein